jgi:hypothetical protein
MLPSPVFTSRKNNDPINFRVAPKRMANRHVKTPLENEMKDEEFSDPELEQIKRFGQALVGEPTPFDEEVEYYLNKYLRSKSELPDEDE